MKKEVLPPLSSKLFILFFLGLFIFSTNGLALPFTVIPKTGTQLPTAVKSGQTATAYYTVINNTLAARTNNFVKYLPPNVVQVTKGATYPDTCGTQFNLAGKGQPASSCTLQLRIAGPVNNNAPDPHHHLFVCFPGGITCAGTQFPLNVTQEPPEVQTAYVTNFNDGSVSRCPIESNGHFGVCSKAITGIGQPSGISFNQNLPYVYITEPGYGFVLYCPVNNDGTFGDCLATPGVSAFFSPAGIVVNPGNTQTYITDQSQGSVSNCFIESDGSLSSCSTASGFNNPLGIAFNPAGTYVYIAEAGGASVSSCPINDNGSLGNCIANSAQDIITLPYAVAINPVNTFAYVVNGDNSVAYCAINTDGSLSECNLTGNDFNFPVAISINATGTYAFIVNLNNNTVSSCPINNDGRFGNCSTTGSDFVNPAGIALR